MNEKEFKGAADQFRNSEFISAAETLAGRTRSAPVNAVIARAVICDGVINSDGKKENAVPAFVLATEAGKEMGLRLRMNATRRKIIIAAADTVQFVKLKGMGIKVRLYQTVDSDRVTGGKTAAIAIAIDVLNPHTGKWLRYYDYQQPRGRKHVEASGLTDNWSVTDMPEPATEATAPPTMDTAVTEEQLRAAWQEGSDLTGDALDNWNASYKSNSARIAGDIPL